MNNLEKKLNYNVDLAHILHSFKRTYKVENLHEVYYHYNRIQLQLEFKNPDWSVEDVQHEAILRTARYLQTYKGERK
jgi:hypothetical protein